MNPKPIFIAEVKTKSPFDVAPRIYGPRKQSFHELAELAIKYGDWISVHTNPLWGGGYEAIEYVRRLTDKPILAKGIHSRNDDIKKAFDYGADYVLCVDRDFWKNGHREWSEYPASNIIMELSSLDVVSADTLGQMTAMGTKVVHNRRDMKTGKTIFTPDMYAEYRAKFKWLCGASTIHVPSNVEQLFPGCDAFIVGTCLPLFCSILDSKSRDITVANIQDL